MKSSTIAKVLLVLTCLSFTAACQGVKGIVLFKQQSGGLTVPGAEINFVPAEGQGTFGPGQSKAGGLYKIPTASGLHTIEVNHPDYIYTKNETVDVPEGSFIVHYIELEEKVVEPTANLVLITTSLLPQTDALLGAIEAYMQTIEEKEGLTSAYVILDSDACETEYGVKLEDISSWQTTREVIQAVQAGSGAAYIIILGGKQTVAAPQFSSQGVYPYSDALYIDQDGDYKPEAGLVISRMPGVLGDDASIVKMLQTAVMLHNAGGHTIAGSEVSVGSAATTPPGCMNGEGCDLDALKNLINNTDRLSFGGHGSNCSMENADLTHEIMNVCNGQYPEDLFDFDTHNPVVLNFYICGTGAMGSSTFMTLLENVSFPHVFMKEGAGAFIGKSAALPYDAQMNIESNFVTFFLDEGDRIGDAFYKAMRIDMDFSDLFKMKVLQYVLYGDPVLRRKP